MTRKALVVGVNYYAHLPHLHGCVSDAYAVKGVLENHADGSNNFGKGVKEIVAGSRDQAISRGDLKDKIADLFDGQSEVALLYFAGHGHIELTGGYLCASDCRRGDDGLALSDIQVMAHRSRALNKIIVLDSCHSGVAGSPPGGAAAELSEGMTFLTASTEDQYASEENGRGVFTALFVDAMLGAAGNLVGDVTPGSVYAHVDQSLGPWDQRPVFKTNVQNFVSLRRVRPPLELRELKMLSVLFPTPGYVFPLDPSFEPEMRGRASGMPPPSLENTAKFAVLQKYNRVNLLVPVGAPHMWHAAMESRACQLTTLGEHYRRLVARGLI